MEQQADEFYNRVREGYRQLATHEPKRIVLINGSRDPDEIETEIWKKLCSSFSVLAKASTT